MIILEVGMPSGNLPCTSGKLFTARISSSVSSISVLTIPTFVLLIVAGLYSNSSFRSTVFPQPFSPAMIIVSTVLPSVLVKSNWQFFLESDDSQI